MCCYFNKKDKINKLIKLALPNYITFLEAHDKSQTIQIAKKIGVPCPETFFPMNFEDVRKNA